MAVLSAFFVGHGGDGVFLEASSCAGDIRYFGHCKY